eukprot:g18562.t1
MKSLNSPGTTVRVCLRQLPGRTMTEGHRPQVQERRDKLRHCALHESTATCSCEEAEWSSAGQSFRQYWQGWHLLWWGMRLLLGAGLERALLGTTKHAVNRNPSVVVWVEASARPLGQMAEWPSKSSSQPAWFSARCLGFQLSAMTSDRAPPVVSFQILDCKAVLRPRTVYLVRHGESQWNKAQGKMDIHGMVRTTDHSLSAKGREQAEKLCHALRTELEKDLAGTAHPSIGPMLRPGMIMTSPLGRALQTAVIAYGPILTKAAAPCKNQMVLAPNCKEPCSCEKFMVSTFEQMQFDLEEVKDTWWPPGQSESTKQLQARLEEFMYQLLFASQQSIVVFGHSLFFQQLMRRFFSDSYRPNELAQRLSTGKLPNCGVVRLDLDRLWAELVLGTTLHSEGKCAMTCCAAEHDTINEIRPDDTLSLPVESTIANVPAGEILKPAREAADKDEAAIQADVGDWRPQVASLLVDFGPGTDRVDQAEEFFAELARLPSGASADLSLTKQQNGPSRSCSFLSDSQAWNVQCAEQLSKELRELLVSSVLRDAPTPRTALAAVTLGGLPGLLPPEASKSVLETADDGSRDEAIELMAKGLALESQRFLVQLRQEHGRAKAAAKAVQVLGLEEEFPDAEFHWKKEALESAICKGRREAMVGLSCQDIQGEGQGISIDITQLQESRLHSRCVQGLLECNEVELAADLGMTWNVALPELSEKLKEAKMKREAECFSLPEAVSINLVEDEVKLSGRSLTEGDGASKRVSKGGRGKIVLTLVYHVINDHWI